MENPIPHKGSSTNNTRCHLPFNMATQSSPGEHGSESQSVIRELVPLGTLSGDPRPSDMTTQSSPGEHGPQSQSVIQQSVPLDTLSGNHLPSDITSQSSPEGHDSQSESAVQQSVSLSAENAHNNENPAPSRRSSPRPTATGSRCWVRLIHMITSRIFIINISSLVWGFFYVYCNVFPLSTADRTVNATTKTWLVFTLFQSFWIGGCVFANYLSLYIWSRSSLSVPDNAQPTLPAEAPSNRAWSPSTFIIRAIIYILYFTLPALPAWWYYPLQAGWQRAVWRHDACVGWGLSITMSTLHFNEIGGSGKLSSATLLHSNGSKFIMELSHPASNISATSLYAVSNSSPPLSDAVFNFTTLTYATSTNLSGSFTNSPVPSFPELSLRSQYPRINWRFSCYAPRLSIIASDNRVVLRTRSRNYDDCAQLKACGSGNIETLIVPLSVALIELENAGLCCTNPYSQRPNESDPTSSNNTDCGSISKYLYNPAEQIPANPDISGKGVRYTIYAQALLNNIVALLGHTADEAISLNVANAVAILALALATTYLKHPDWPHLVIVYYFFLLIWLSGISYNTVQPQLRSRSEFIPLIERLNNIDIIILPFFVIISLALWFGILIAQHRQKLFPSKDCTFGQWVFFGRTIDLKTTHSVTIGLTLAIPGVAWVIGSLLVDTIFRRISYKKLSRIRGRRQEQDDGVSMTHTLFSVQQEISLVGNYPSNWIWRHLEPILSSQLFSRILPFRLGLRKLTFGWRFGIWGYLLATTEQLVSANDFQDEQHLSFGQAYALVLLIVPFGVLWGIVYRAFPSFARYLNSPQGRYWITYNAHFMLGLVLGQFAWALVEKKLFRIILSLIVMACFIVSITIRQFFSQEVNQWLGTNVYPPASSFWAMWSARLEIRLPDPVCDPDADVDSSAVRSGGIR